MSAFLMAEPLVPRTGPGIKQALCELLGKEWMLESLRMAKKLKRSQTISHTSRDLNTCLQKIVTTKILVINLSVCNWFSSVTTNLVSQITDGDGHCLPVINYELGIHKKAAG